MASRAGLPSKGKSHMPVRVRWRDGEGLENVMRQEKMKIWFVQLKEEKTLGGPYHWLQLSRGGCSKDGTRPSSQVLDDRTTSNGHN